MNTNEICAQIIQNVEAALGCAVVDLNTGLLLGISHKIPYLTLSSLDIFAATSVNMFRGRTVMTIEQMLSNIRGKEECMMIREIQMATENTYHFMATIPDKPNFLVVLVTNKKAHLGIGWSILRQALPKIAPLCP